MTQPTKEDSNLEVTSLDTFVALLSNWHQSKVAGLEHMLQVPAGVEMQVDDGPPVILSGERLDGFKAGISLALMELGILPFATVSSDTEEDVNPEVH